MIPDATAPYLFVGLGNPGRKYRLNRHNIGFMVLDALAKEIGASFTRHQSQALITKGRLDLGPWQQVYYAEFDGQRRKRAIIKIIGE